MQALLIIDMQVGPFAETPRLDAPSMIQRINRLSDSFRSQGKPVIFIQHDGSKEDYLFPGSPEWQILPDLIRSDSDKLIGKNANDAFYRTELENYLQEKGINELVICGCATDFCVNATVHSALVKDFNLTVVSDAHTTGDRPGLTARQLIDFHNWLWPNLAATEGKITLKQTAELLA